MIAFLLVFFAVNSWRAFALNSTHVPTFDAFIEMHHRSYRKGTAEYDMRKTVYESRVIAAKRQNQLGGRWQAAVNKLSDWTGDELQKLRGWNGDVRPLHSSNRKSSIRRNFLQQDAVENELPAEKSWSNLETAKRIHNQGGCGSCWAIASSTVLEFHSEIHRGQRRTFSAQQIVSCTPNPRECGGTGRCSGATAELAMEYVMKNGCAEESAVPYTGQDGTCTQPDMSPSASFLMNAAFDGQSANSGGSAFGMIGWETLPRNEADPLMRALVERGPVAVSVAASDWNSYETGVFDSCSKDAIIDHAVTLIGYGQAGSDLVWVIQNSWGSDWGEGGHIRLLRQDGVDAYCGMDDQPTLGTACKGENEPVRVCGMCGVLYDSVVPHFS
jgi:cathepsin L